jgi:hypothetical protein
MKNDKWYRFRIGVDNNSDYSDGKNKRVLNSRFDGYSLMIARDHRNHVGSLLEMARYVFRDRKLKIDYHPDNQVLM